MATTITPEAPCACCRAVSRMGVCVPELLGGSSAYELALPGVQDPLCLDPPIVTPDGESCDAARTWGLSVAVIYARGNAGGIELAESPATDLPGKVEEL
jgi:hypothetical protein